MFAFLIGGKKFSNWSVNRKITLKYHYENVKYYSKSTKIVKIPGVIKLKDLARIVKEDLPKVTSLYKKHPNSIPFDHHSKVIVPYSIAESIAKSFHLQAEYKEIDLFPTFQRSNGLFILLYFFLLIFIYYFISNGEQNEIYNYNNINNYNNNKQ